MARHKNYLAGAACAQQRKRARKNRSPGTAGGLPESRRWRHGDLSNPGIKSQMARWKSRQSVAALRLGMGLFKRSASNMTCNTLRCGL